MSIPKGLILYKTPRYRESLPVNIKQRYYSNKIIISPPNPDTKQYTNFCRQYQKKFSQEIQLKIYDTAPRKNPVLAIWPKFSHVTKCRIEPAYQVFQEKSIKSIMQGFQSVFKVLKRIKKLVIGLSGEPQNRAQASKSLLLLNNLESLTLPSFSYDENNKTMKLFMEAVKSASKRKSWPKLKSLNIQLQPPSLNATNPVNDGLFTRSLRKLLEFMDGLETCHKIYDCLNFELKLSPWASINREQADLLIEIAEIAPFITSLQGCEANRFSKLSELVQYCEQLNRVGLSLHGVSQPDLNLRALEESPNFQELTLWDVFLEKKLLTQIRSLENLTALSLRFRKMPAASSGEALDLSRVISDLPNLKSLELDFSSQIYFGPGKSKLESYPWLSATFQAIGKKSKLEKLSLTFSAFEFENSRLVFKGLCQNIENLTNLSYCKLHIMYADMLGDQEVLALGQCLSKLTKLQELTLKLSKDFSFGTKTYFALIDSFVKNCPLLSKLWLLVGSVEMNDECYELLLRKMNKVRCLNWVSLSFQGGDLQSDVGLKNLAMKLRKKRGGGVDYFNRNEGYVLRF